MATAAQTTQPVTEVLVLCYHAVSPRWESEISVTPERLEAQVRFLLERGYRGATFHDAVTAPAAPKTVVVTFDDGFRSVFEHGFEVLEGLGVPGTIFVVTEFVGSSAPMVWPGIDAEPDAAAAELAPVSWEQLRELGEAGWEVGSHTSTHPFLTRCDDASLERELSVSRHRCEHNLGRPCRSLAYPYGDADERVVGATAAAGYLAACTLQDRLGQREQLQWPRIGVWHDDTDTRFRLKVSPPFRRLRGSPAWTTLATAGRLASRPR